MGNLTKVKATHWHLGTRIWVRRDDGEIIPTRVFCVNVAITKDGQHLTYGYWYKNKLRFAKNEAVGPRLPDNEVSDET